MVNRRRPDERVALARIAYVVLAVIAAPLLLSVARAIGVGTAASQWALWWPSLALAGAAACIAIVTGLLGYVAASGGRRAGFGWVLFAVTSACALPSYVHALAWSWLLPEPVLQRGPLVAACVLGFSYAPTTFLILTLCLKAPPLQLTEAAWLVGLGAFRARLLLIRRAVPSILVAWLIAFLLSFSDFPVPDYFRVATYATEVFARVAAWLDPAAAGILALPMLVTAAVSIGLLAYAFRRLQRTTTSEDSSGRVPERSLGERVARLAAGLIFASLVSVAPICALAGRVPDARTLTTALHALSAELPDTLMIGLVTGVIASVCGATLAFLDVRRVVSGAHMARLAAWGALAWPASLVCLGAIALANAPGLRQSLPESTMIVAVLVLRWLVLSYEVWSNFWMRMPARLEESCWLVGMPWWQALGRLLALHGGPAFGASLLLVASFSINDLTVFVLLSPPGFSTTTLNIFSAVHYGPSGYLAALCVCQVLLVTLIAFSGVLLTRLVSAAPSVKGVFHAAR